MEEGEAKVPTANELVGPPPRGPDAKWVLGNFLGKTREEVREILRRDLAPVAEDFTYMAATGLCYYLPVALSYLESEESEGNWLFVHGLMCALSSQVRYFGMRGEPLVIFKRIAEYCASHREKFQFENEDNDLFDKFFQVIRDAS